MFRELRETKRACMGTIYFSAGIIIILVDSFSGISFLFWCLGCSSMGVGAGLINTRKHKQQYCFHLIFYYLFILLVVSLVSFTVPLYLSDQTTVNELKTLNLLSMPSLKFYSLAAIVGLTGGLLGLRLSNLLESLIKNLNK